MIHIFTSSAPNYVGKVRALCESLRVHFPEAMIHWAVADRRSDELLDVLGDGEIDELIFVDDLTDASDSAWLFQHAVVELSTAIKPEVALSLLSRPDCDTLLYFDPDIVVFSPLDDLLEKLASSSLVLTPHLLKPEREDDGVRDHEISCLRHGVFNLGFFGIRQCKEGRDFLEWWHKRCHDYCWGDWRTGVFTDQKWVNFAPIFFPNAAILRDQRFNVAPWNINQRLVQGSFDEGFTVDNSPLGFYHFTGFDSGAHDLMLSKYGRGRGVVEMLTDWYRRRTAWLTPEENIDWKLGSYANGQSILPSHRVIYRKREDLQTVFPDPYSVPDGKLSLLRWMTETAPIEVPELLDESVRAEVEMTAVKEREELRRSLTEILESKSWKYTAPMRRFLKPFEHFLNGS